MRASDDAVSISNVSSLLVKSVTRQQSHTASPTYLVAMSTSIASTSSRTATAGQQIGLAALKKSYEIWLLFEPAIDASML